MKYMGSKRHMLKNGLGETLTAEIPKANRFVDLFTGSGAVAWYAAKGWNKPVIAGDLQYFAVLLAASVVARDVFVQKDDLFREWIRCAEDLVKKSPIYELSKSLQERLCIDGVDLEGEAELARDICKEAGCGPIQRAYGGYYFSPLQSLWFDCMRQTLPQDKNAHAVGLAALIHAASKCAAAPGHTAQPFKPNKSAGPFLREAWMRDVCDAVSSCYEVVGSSHAKVIGEALHLDALSLSGKMRDGDLAFVDPPYSSVHYSRFYHVLETISKGEDVDVSGIGRYPPGDERPKSEFSIKTQAPAAFRRLLSSISGSGARAIITFPADECSNGLSGQAIIDMADAFFSIERTIVTSRFSTLGGNRVNRAARLSAKELILTLRPK